MTNSLRKFEIVKITGDRKRKKYAIVSGLSILARFFTAEAAAKAAEKNRSFYEYWANSASVSLDNSKWEIVNI